MDIVFSYLTQESRLGFFVSTKTLRKLLSKYQGCKYDTFFKCQKQTKVVFEYVLYILIVVFSRYLNYF